MIFSLVFLALGLGLCAGNSSGPPANISTCVNLVPSAASPHVRQDGNGTYDLTISNLMRNSSLGYFEFSPSQTYAGELA